MCHCAEKAQLGLSSLLSFPLHLVQRTLGIQVEIVGVALPSKQEETHEVVSIDICDRSH